MDRKSCFHCGIRDTALWRRGPSEKPTLCNPCGTRWRLKGTLDNYTPKHGLTHPKILAEKAKVKGLPLSIKVPTRKRSVLPRTQMLPRAQMHIRRLHQQLLQILHEQQSADKISATGEEENDVLIDNTGWLTSSSETALGAVLLK